MLRVHKLGVSAGEFFLLEDDDTSFVIDSGFAFDGYNAAKKIREILGGRSLDAILLTHSHYDHAGGSVYIQKEFPNAPIYAHEYAAKVFSKEGAKKVMREMDLNKANLCGVKDYECLIDQLHVDHVVHPWDEIQVGSYTFKVIPLPGHTLCSVGYWCESEKLLLACETIGSPSGEEVIVPNYMVGYKMTLESIDLASTLPVEHMLLSHYGMLEGHEACRKFFEDSKYWAIKTHDLLHELHNSGKSLDYCTEELKKLLYTPEIAKHQPEKAFYLNLSYTIPMLLKEP